MPGLTQLCYAGHKGQNDLQEISNNRNPNRRANGPIGTANWGQLVSQWGGDDMLQDPLGRINVIFNYFTTYPSYVQ